MNEWKPAVLGDVAIVQSGFAFKSRDWRSQGIPVVRIQNVRGGRVDLSNCLYVEPAVAEAAPRAQLARGDVLITMSGEIGSIGVVRTDDQLLLNQRVGRLSLRAGAPASLSFLSYVLQSPKLKQTMEVIAYGAAQPNISPSLISSLPILLPPMHAQNKIAGFLTAIADLIEINRRRVEVLEEMARAIYREWFVRFRYPGHEDVPLVESPLGPLPDGWAALPASDALDINPKGQLTRGVRCRQMTMGDLDERTLNCEPGGWKDSPSGSRFQNGDTLFARITPCLENGKTGFMQALAQGEAACGSTEFIVLRGRLVGPGFTYLLARSDSFRGHAISSMSGASGRQRVRNECFDSFLVATPPPAMAAKFEATIVPLFVTVQVLRGVAR